MTTDNLTPSSVDAAELAREGFTADFYLDVDAVVDRDTDTRYDPADVRVVEERRYEGPTDPADESVLLALEAPDGTKGTVTATYGANSEHADVVRLLGVNHRS